MSVTPMYKERERERERERESARPMRATPIKEQRARARVRPMSVTPIYQSHTLAEHSDGGLVWGLRFRV